MTKSQILIKYQPPNPNLKGAPRPYDIRERAFEFGLRILDLLEKVPPGVAAEAVRRQLARAGPSVGANLEEGDGAGSRQDKRKSFIIARKEAREARYWLRVIDRKWPQVAGVQAEISEASEIINIVSTIIEKLS